MSISSLPSVSVVFPVFNEAENLWDVVQGALRVLQRDYAGAWEIIVVDDGSADDTPMVWEKILETHRTLPLRIIRHDRNRGYGAALRTGFAAATCDSIFFTDADEQFRLDDLAKFSQALLDHDMIIGWRAERRDSIMRKCIASFGNWLARTLLKARARDVNCAYKLFHRELLQALPLKTDGLLVNAEILALAARARWSFIELPVPHFPRLRGTATGAKPAVILQAVREYFHLRRRLAAINPAPWTPPAEASARSQGFIEEVAPKGRR
jgi:glycosyltransferase involved in cell wall biosynthesis